MDDLLIYLIYFFVELIICSLSVKYKSKKLYFISFIISFIIIGFRYEVGTDYNNYIRTFENIKSFSSFDNLINYRWEKGATFLFKIISFFINDGKLIFLPITALTLYPLYKINKIYDYKYLPLSIFIYNTIYLPFAMNGMRQGIAMNFTLLSFILLLNNEKKNSVINFIIAYLFHKSCILLLPYYLLLYFDKSDDKKKTSKLFIIVSIAMSFFIIFFLKDIINSTDLDFYNSYINRIDANNLSFSYFIMYIPTILILVFMKSKDKIINTFKSLVISGYIIGLIGTTAVYLNRIALYFNIFEIILIPYLINRIKKKNTKICIIIIYIIYLISFFIYQFYLLGRHEIFPYKNWLFL